MPSGPWITGRTRIYALLAHPSAHVRTPEVFNAAAVRNGLDLVTVAVDVSPDGLAAIVAAFKEWRNLAGMGVTVPHKEAVVALVDELGAQASVVGAVNVIRREPDGRLVGDMFDGLGFVAGLRGAGHEPAGRRTLLIGAGGTARAIAFALADAGVSELVIANRTRARAVRLAGDVAAVYGSIATSGEPEAQGFDLVVNATTLGMHAGDALPVDPSRLGPGTVVAEVVMTPARTPLLAVAERAGCAVHPGLRMLEAQREMNLRFLGVS